MKKKKLKITLFLCISVLALVAFIWGCSVMKPTETYYRAIDISLLKSFKVASAHNIKLNKGSTPYTGVYYRIPGNFVISERINGKNFEVKAFSLGGIPISEQESFGKGVSISYDEEGKVVECMLVKNDGSWISFILSKDETTWTMSGQEELDSFGNIIRRIPNTENNSTEIKEIIQDIKKQRRRQTIFVTTDQIKVQSTCIVLYEERPYTGFVLDFKTKAKSISLQLYDSGHEVKNNTFVIDLLSKP